VIFVTVGTQLPFDRMVAAVDAWAALAPGQQVFAQIGPTDLRPRHIDHRAFVSPAECHELMLAADAIVAHAGMGTILRALELGKPLLVLPRRAQRSPAGDCAALRRTWQGRGGLRRGPAS
jgi:UDP-N-acetylglucosamine transferase subunit ALG13